VIVGWWLVAGGWWLVHAMAKPLLAPSGG
jgi:hypothetical protein